MNKALRIPGVTYKKEWYVQSGTSRFSPAWFLLYGVRRKPFGLVQRYYGVRGFDASIFRITLDNYRGLSPR